MLSSLEGCLSPWKREKIKEEKENLSSRSLSRGRRGGSGCIDHAGGVDEDDTASEGGEEKKGDGSAISFLRRGRVSSLLLPLQRRIFQMCLFGGGEVT